MHAILSQAQARASISRLADFFSDGDGAVIVALGVNLRDVCAGVSEHDLRGLEAECGADARCEKVPEHVRRPARHAGSCRRAGYSAAVCVCSIMRGIFTPIAQIVALARF